MHFGLQATAFFSCSFFSVALSLYHAQFKQFIQFHFALCSIPVTVV